MDAIEIVGGSPLRGRVRAPGAKNSVLKLMAVALLAEGTTTLLDVPDILDVTYQAELLRHLGAEVVVRPGRVDVTVPERLNHRADYELVRRLRASINVLGPLLARCGVAEVALPGGDNIGSRGLDLHVAGLEKLGATVRSEHGFLVATRSGRLQGATVWLDFPSVGATENLLTAAVTAKGITVIDNAAREPEIVDIAELLVEMGARIDGIGTSTMVVDGVEDLAAVTHTTVPDRIVAGTWAAAAAITRGDIEIDNAVAGHLQIVLDKLASAGADISVGARTIRVRCDERPRAVDVVTLPYPGFPSDLQPMFLTLAATSEGSAMVTENLYEARFRFVNELVRLGADVRTDGNHALVRGVPRLSGAPVEASDIRAGAALVLAGLVADGTTTVYEPHHIARGYAGFVADLVSLGGDVRTI